MAKPASSPPPSSEFQIVLGIEKLMMVMLSHNYSTLSHASRTDVLLRNNNLDFANATKDVLFYIRCFCLLTKEDCMLQENDLAVPQRKYNATSETEA